MPGLYYRTQGRLGDTVTLEIPITNQSQQDYVVAPALSVGAAQTVTGESSHTLRYQLFTGVADTLIELILRAKQPATGQIKLSVQMLGYHLTGADFATSIDASEVFHLKDTNHYLLQNTDTEKLLTLQREGQVYLRKTIGSTINRIPVAALPEGVYVLELQDLRSQERRFVRIHR